MIVYKYLNKLISEKVWNIIIENKFIWILLIKQNIPINQINSFSLKYTNLVLYEVT